MLGSSSPLCSNESVSLANRFWLPPGKCKGYLQSSLSSVLMKSRQELSCMARVQKVTSDQRPLSSEPRLDWRLRHLPTGSDSWQEQLS
ncbi:hypothetical protein AV530_017539 [Patagioenas fasciata monilis]|uniref:Uncharacterized protein n=1 Tax=Patagioenas fasciata monilis TaxID=372326 RepID=A0A1V4JCV3_PATFA|nr:hypothetical protein AV530_017539 [Patagioenas fasciata monilis]